MTFQCFTCDSLNLSANERKIIISALESMESRLANMISNCERNQENHPAIHRLRNEWASVERLLRRIIEGNSPVDGVEVPALKLKLTDLVLEKPVDRASALRNIAKIRAKLAGENSPVAGVEVPGRHANTESMER